MRAIDRDLLRMEAELQRQTLRTEIDSLRRRPAHALIKGLGAMKGLGGGVMPSSTLTRVATVLLGRRAPWLVFGWLAFRTFRSLFPAQPRRRPFRR